MPPKKNKPKTKRKKQYVKPKIKRTFVSRPITGPFNAINGDPFPLKYNAKLRYCDTVAVASGTVGVFGDEFVFKLNGLYDPNTTGIGHQPYGYDQITPLYKRYIVKGVLIKIVFNNPSADGIVCGAMIQGSSGAGSLTGISPDIIKEQPYSITHPLNNTGSQYYMVKQYIDLRKLEGLKVSQWDSNITNYGALVTADPLLQPTLRVACATDTATSGITLTCRVLLTYYVQFFDRTLLAYS